MPLRFSIEPTTLARTAAATLVAVMVSGCAGMSDIEFFPAFNRTQEQAAAAPSPSVETQPVDPLTAPPPAIDPLTAPPPSVDPMAAPASSASSGSRLVPLGTLAPVETAAAPRRSGPAPLIPNAPATSAAVPAAEPAPQPMAQVQASAASPAAPGPTQPTAVLPVAAPQSAPPQPALPQPETLAVAAQPALPSPAPVQAPSQRATLADFFKRTMPTTDPQVAAPGTGVLFPEPPQPEAREFIPAQIAAAEPMTNAARLAPKLSVADSNIIRRFEVLLRLLDEGLITQDEYDRRRSANIGALLPYSKDPPGIGLDRTVPAAGAISARLQALGRSLEMRAITARQHELERGIILNSLLPERPDPRAPKAPPPADMFALADAAARLGYLREEELITEAEFEAEKAAMDRVMRGADPIERKPVAASAAKAALPKAAPPEAAPPAPETLAGPVLHLASFRSAEGARSGFEQAKAKNPQLFANLRYEARRTNVPGQGTFYRLLVGPFDSLAAAEAACVEMKKADQFCRPTPDGS